MWRRKLLLLLLLCFHSCKGRIFKPHKRKTQTLNSLFDCTLSLRGAEASSSRFPYSEGFCWMNFLSQLVFFFFCFTQSIPRNKQTGMTHFAESGKWDRKSSLSYDKRFWITETSSITQRLQLCELNVLGFPQISYQRKKERKGQLFSLNTTQGHRQTLSGTYKLLLLAKAYSSASQTKHFIYLFY